MDEGKLWSLIRNVLSQGTVIQLDYAARRYEEYSARLDTAASERVPDFTKLADARIAELERERSQWRDELRIYRETENKRIAELEQSVTVLDTEVARLETDLELARIECAGLERRVKSLDESLHALVEVSEDSTIARARALLNGDDIGEDEDAARAGNGGEG